jgi:hypothetical protein
MYQIHSHKNALRTVTIPHCVIRDKFSDLLQLEQKTSRDKLASSLNCNLVRVETLPLVVFGNSMKPKL